MNYIKKSIWRTRLAIQGNVLKNLRQLNKLQWLDSDQTYELQMERLEQLLMHAYRHVPYYRTVLSDSEIVDRDGRVCLARFHQIPLLDKDIIRLSFDDLKSHDLDNRKWYENTSGGSTGEPARFIQDKCYSEMSSAVKMLDDLWSGYSTGERKVILWGSERDLLVGKETPKTVLGRFLRDEIWLNSYRMTNESLCAYAKSINTFKPAQILAYVESIYELSQFVERENLDMYNPKAIMTSAGTLLPYMRKKIEQVFNAPVFNRYGSREVGDIACECNHHRGLHVSAPTHYVEVLKEDGTAADSGEVGEIVITLLTNYSMPLIRYRIGDMGMWAKEPCSCGRGWPLLGEVTGRVTDNFKSEDGTIIYGGYIRQLLYYRDWIRKYQIIQEDYNLISIQIVASKQKQDLREYYARELGEIAEKIKIAMGDCRVEYDFVNDITSTQSGKFRYTISKVA